MGNRAILDAGVFSRGRKAGTWASVQGRVVAGHQEEGGGRGQGAREF